MGTQVRSMRTLERGRLTEKAPQSTERKPRLRGAFWDRLGRNLAVAGGLLLVLAALRGSGSVEAQSVFSAIQENANLQWDESLGKLVFVSNLLPESIQAVWSEAETITTLAPCRGEITHAWSEREPYVELDATVADVRAAAGGELMAIAHGPEEELILRIRHEDGTESLYGNLSSCLLEEGARVYAGDLLGQLMEDRPLCFELRREGRSVRPNLQQLEEP